MSSFLTVLLGFVICIRNVCNADYHDCLAFSGGGIRAAMGTYWVMRAIENHGKLGQIKCISLISGGSWGFVLWLYEEKPGSADDAILKWMLDHDMNHWGTKGPGEKGWPLGIGSSWWVRWLGEIEKHILKMTTLKDAVNTEFDSSFRAKLKARGLGHTTVYFVVESVETNLHTISTEGAGFTIPLIKKKVELWKAHEHTFTNRLWGLADFKDYCWFESAPIATDGTDAGETFACSKAISGCPSNGCPMTSVTISSSTTHHEKEPHAVRLSEVLAYCSSAWATRAAMVSLTKHTTPIITVARPSGPKGGTRKALRFRLVDAGGTFNNPLVPLMIDDAYLLAKKVRIWNYDFSEQDNNVGEISHLNEIMKRIDKPIEDFVWRKSTGHNRAQVFKISHRLIYHCPLFGKWSKDKMMKEFPTMGGLTGTVIVNRWSMKTYLYFKEDWFGNVDGVHGLITAM